MVKKIIWVGILEIGEIKWLEINDMGLVGNDYGLVRVIRDW